MIGDELGTTSTMPAHCRISFNWPKAGNISVEAGDDDLLRRRIAALAVGGNAVEPAAEHEFALVRLADVRAGPEMQEHDVETGLYRLAHHRLQRVRVDRQPDPRFRHELGRVAGDRDADSLGADFALRRLNPRCRRRSR